MHITGRGPQHGGEGRWEIPGGEPGPPPPPPPTPAGRTRPLLPSWAASSLGSGPQPRWCFRTYSWERPGRLGRNWHYRPPLECQRIIGSPPSVKVGSGIPPHFPGWQTEAQDKGNHMPDITQPASGRGQNSRSPLLAMPCDLATRLIHSYPEKAGEGQEDTPRETTGEGLRRWEKSGLAGHP